jgi:hypothetical protein
MKSKGFINPSDDVAKYFSSEVLDEADRDFSELFLSMFSEARRIALEECGKKVDFQIDRAAWQQGKWITLKRPERSRKFRFWLTVFRYANLVIPIGIGFALADLSVWYWLFAACAGVFVITFICEERMEDRR